MDALLTAIKLASDPNQPPTVYRVARREAVRLTRQAVRDAIANEYRERLQQSAALPPMTQADHEAIERSLGLWPGE